MGAVDGKTSSDRGDSVKCGGGSLNMSGPKRHKFAQAKASVDPQVVVVLLSRVLQEPCMRNWQQRLTHPLQVAEVEVAAEWKINRKGPSELSFCVSC